MKLDSLKSKASKCIVSSLNLTRFGRQKFISQWGIVKFSYQGNLMWVELLDRKVSIELEERKGLLEDLEETIKELIPYDVIGYEVQYKIF